MIYKSLITCREHFCSNHLKQPLPTHSPKHLKHSPGPQNCNSTRDIPSKLQKPVTPYPRKLIKLEILFLRFFVCVCVWLLLFLLCVCVSVCVFSLFFPCVLMFVAFWFISSPQALLHMIWHPLGICLPLSFCFLSFVCFCF